jgi:mannose-6-phosphate isomerase-like protein (cupin superfamily)
LPDLPKVEIVEVFTPSDINQPYGGVTEVPLRAKQMRWGLEVLMAHTSAYTGKILFRKADESYAGIMQYHVNKEETFYLFSGECLLRWDTGDGKLSTMEIGPGRAFHIPRGARHSIVARTDCVFFEVSTPHFEDRVNVEDQYG